MKPIMEITQILTSFVYQKASLLSTVPLFIAMPIRRVSKMTKAGTKETEQEVEAVCNNNELWQNKPKPKPKNIILSLSGLISSLVLTGCTGSTYSTHFDCPMGEGAGCASISKVNKMIDRQEIDLGNDDAPSCKGSCARQLGGNPTALGNQVYVYYGPDQLSRLISIDGLGGN